MKGNLLRIRTVIQIAGLDLPTKGGMVLSICKVYAYSPPQSEVKKASGWLIARTN